MTRAFIVLARNDLHPNELQVLDLQPNTSQRNLIYDPVGQTGYLSFFVQNDLPTVAGVGPILSTSKVYGLGAYLLSNIDNQSLGGHKTPSVANCTAIAVAILAKVNSGLALTQALVDAAVAATIALSDLTGLTAAGSLSTGSISGLLRVLNGEAFRLANGAIVAAGGGAAFVGNVGTFVTAADRTPASNALFGGNQGALTSFGSPVASSQVPAQVGARDVNFRDLRRLEVTGAMSISAGQGALSKLKSSTFDWFNPAYTYVAVTGTAKNIAGTILTTHLARGVVVYDDAGNVI